jgi:hypothetical protein
VASTWAFEAQGPGSIPGGGATSEAVGNGGATIITKIFISDRVHS